MPPPPPVAITLRRPALRLCNAPPCSEAMLAHGVVDRAELGLFEMVDEPEEGWEALLRRGLTAHR